MKVLSINVYNYRKGGSETVYFNTSDLLEKHGHEVARFTLKWDKNESARYDYLFPESKETRKGIFRPISNVLTYFYHAGAARKIKKLIKDFKPDIAQVHLIWGQLTPSILKALKKCKVPVVLTIHDYRIVCPAYTFRNGKGEVCEACQGKKFYKCFTNACNRGSKGLSGLMAAEQYFRNTFFNPSKYSQGILYVSKFAESIHEKYMPSLKQLKKAQLYNMSSDIASKPVAPTTIPYYLYFGRLSEEKGIETLIEAFKEFPDVDLKVVGTGPLEDTIKLQIKKENITNIEMLGYKSGDELKELVGRAKFVIVPSTWYENNPMTIIEAYSQGTPVIGANIGGIPEIVINGVTGYQFQPRDVKSLVEVVKKSMQLSLNEYSQMQESALLFAKENFDSEKYYDSLINFFNEIIENKNN